MTVPDIFQKLKSFTLAHAQGHKQPWIKAQNIMLDKNRTVNIRNESERVVSLSKHEHFATLTPCIEVLVDEISDKTYVIKIYNLNRNDLSHLIPHPMDSVNQTDDDYLKVISLDPDNILPASWKKRLFTVCQRFSHLITPRLGKYIGFFGQVDNSINFTSTPPPSTKARLPKYNHKMLRIMADKMDRLEEWGVLRKPEDIGVVPEFVLPSMLTTKSEENEWRLVTDFTLLNIHIKKLETVGPTINEAKNKLAKFKYHIQ